MSDYEALRDSLLAEIERLRAERDELLAALQDIASLPGRDPANPFLADAMERLARAAIAKAERK